MKNVKSINNFIKITFSIKEFENCLKNEKKQQIFQMYYHIS